jgi:hypothetical protein
MLTVWPRRTSAVAIGSMRALTVAFGLNAKGAKKTIFTRQGIIHVIDH